MLKKIGISAFLLGVSVTQAFAGSGHAVSSDYEAPAHAEADVHGVAATTAAEHASSGGLPQLDPTSFSSQLFWLVIVFLFMLFFFSKKTIPQISHTIENRTDRISGDLDSADLLRSEVAELQQSYEEKLAQAREESFSVFINGEKEMKAQTEHKSTAFQERSRKKVEELEQNIEVARDKAMIEMSDVATEIALQASEKIIGVKVDEKKAKAIVNSLNNAA
jgi:F-type H+-transporting ATPase subunit b